MLSKTSARSWAVRLTGLILLGVIGFSLSPYLFSEGGKGENLRPELALVPSDAFLFLHLRSGDVWDHDLVAKSRKLLMQNAGNIDFTNVPVDPASIESISVVVQSPEALSLLDGMHGEKVAKKSKSYPATGTAATASTLDPKTMMPPARFEADKDGGVLTRDGKLEIAFKNGDPLRVDPGEKDGVKADIRERRAVFSQFGELPEQDREVFFKVTGGKSGEVVNIKIIVKKREAPPFAADLNRVILEKPGSRAEVGFKNGNPVSVIPPQQEMVKAEIIGNRAVFTQVADSPNDHRNFVFNVMDANKAAAPITVTVTMTKKQAEKKPPFQADLVRVVLDKPGSRVEVGFKNGNPISVNPPQQEMVKADIIGNRAVFTQVADAPNEDKIFSFLVMDADKAEARITIAVNKKQPEKAPPFQADIGRVVLDKPGSRVEVGFKNGNPISVNPPQQEMVKAEINGNRAVFTQVADSPNEDRNFIFTVTSADKAETRITVAVNKKPQEKKLPFQADVNQVTLEKQGSRVEVGFKNGAPLTIHPPQQEMVRAELMNNKAVFTQVADSADQDKTFVFQVTAADKMEARITVIVKKKQQPKKEEKPEQPKPPAEPEQTSSVGLKLIEVVQDACDGQPATKEQDGRPIKKPAPAVPDMLVIVAMKKPYDQAQITQLAGGAAAFPEKRDYKGKPYLISPQGPCLCFAGETLIVLASGEAMLKKALDRPQQAKAEGPQAAALNLAMDKRHLVVGLNFGAPALQAQKKQLAMRLKEPDRFRDLLEPSAPVWTLIPLLETQTATLALDLGKEHKVRVEAGLSYADAERAAEAVGALQDAVALGRVLFLGRLIHAAEFAAGDPAHRQEVLLAALLLKQADAALRRAVIERRQTTVRFQAEGEFDLDYLRGKAKIMADNFVVDPAVVRAANRQQSINNLKQMMLAMHAYHDVYRTLPPQAICSKTGAPLLSWRVTILPYIEELPLYDEFKLDEPWDSPHNIKLLPRMPKVYAPLRGVKTREPHSTFYQVFTGKGTAFELMLDNTSPLGARGLQLFAGFPDGTSNTIGIVEAGDAVPWTKPADLVYDARKPLPLPRSGGPLFQGGFHCALMDGSVRLILPTMSEATLRNAITRDDGNAPGIDW